MEDNLSELPKFDEGQPVFSASQVSTFMLCQRKWGFYALDGIVLPPNASAELGTRVHGVLESWLRNGQAPDLSAEEGRIATAGLSFLPPPGKADVEQHFLIRTQIAEYQGYKDVTWWEGERRIVCDHKTMGDFKWAKTEEDLKTDIQASLYAADEMSRYKLNEVELRWIYYRTRGANQAKKVSLVVYRDQVEKNFDMIDAAASAMLAAHKAGKKGLDLPPTVTSCSAYGGCPHIERCNLKPTDIMRAVMAHQSLAEKLRARAGSVWVDHPDNPQYEWNQATNEIRPKSVTNTPPPIVGSTAPVPLAGPTFVAAAPPIPAAAPPIPTVSAPPIPAAAPPIPTVSAPPIPAAAPPIPAPAIRTAAPVNGGAVGILPPEAPKVIPAAPVQIPTYGQSVIEIKSGLILYLNCQPTKTKRELTSLLQFIDPVHKLLCSENNVKHYRFIPEGAAKLSLSLREWVRLNKPNASVVVSTMSQEGRDCVAVLSELADEVVTSLDC